MKTTDFRFVAAFVVFHLVLIPVHAQPWQYDFGTATGIHSTGASSSFLPTPASGGARVRIGTQGGSVAMQNPGDTRLGSASECVLVAPTGASINKLQVHDFTGGSGFTLQASLLISGGSGDVYFFCGNGSSFSDNLGFSGSQVFSGLKWTNDTTRLILSVRESGTWNALTPAPMRKDSVHLLEVYANNSALGITYAHSTSQSLSAFSWDLWIDGVLVANDVPSSGLPDTIGIDSFMFYASSSPGNSCALRLDDLVYTNNVALQPLPVELSVFEVRQMGSHARLRWKTETELQNFGFEIQRQYETGEWEARGFVPGDGDRSSPRWYEFDDSIEGDCGTLRYRLRQIDRDGSTATTDVRVMELPCEEGSMLFDGPEQQQGIRIGTPWPQPCGDAITIPLRVLREGVGNLEVLTLAGTRVAVLPAVRLLPAGWQDLHLHGIARLNGPHLLVLRCGQTVVSRLLLL